MKNILLISIDTFRFDCVAYQPQKQALLDNNVLQYLETPVLDGIAERSLCFTHCFSTNTYTTSAHATILTGLYPPGHGVREFYRKKLDTNVYGIAEILKIYGYRTVMYTDMLYLFAPLDLNRGFDYFIAGDDSALYKMLADFRNDKSTKNFVFAHFFDLHAPYLASENDRYNNDGQFLLAMEELYSRFSIPFDRSVYSDRDKHLVWENLMHQIGRDVSTLLPLYIRGLSKFDSGRFRDFMSFLESQGYMDGSLFFFFSDHGEGRNDDKNPDSFGHSGPVYDDVIRVPLMIYHRDLQHRVTDRLASIADVFPTVLESATGETPHLNFPYTIDGVNLLGNNHERPVYCETWLNDHADKHWNLEMMSYLLYQRAVRSKSHKYIIFGTPEKFADGKYEGSDEDFLRDYYRCCNAEFESYDTFMANLARIREDPSIKNDMLHMTRGRSFCYVDLVRDPGETTPIFVADVVAAKNDPNFSAILTISGRQSDASNIFDEINERFFEDIAEKLLIRTQRSTIRSLSRNKHLLNELVNAFIHEPDLSDREFIRLAYAIFLRRLPYDGEMAEGENLLKRGITRRLYFNNAIYNNKVFEDVRLAWADPIDLCELLERADYKRKYEELQKSLIFKFFSKTASVMDNIFFPPGTRRRALLLAVLGRVLKTQQ